MKILESSCRVCLKNTENCDSDKQISIEEIDGPPEETISISDKITLCAGIIIDQKQCLATNICKNCNEHLQLAYNFRKTCKKSDNILQEYIKKNYPAKDLSSSSSTIILNECESLNEEEELPDVHVTCSTLDNLYPEIKVEMSSTSENNSEHSEYKPPEKNRSNHKSKKNFNVTSIAKKFRQNKLTKNSTQQKYEMRKSYAVVPYSVALPKIKSKKDDKDTFICELCGNVYKKRALLSDHMRWHSGEKEFQCEICEKTFLLATYLARHMKTHTGIRNFQCTFCSRTFYTNGLKRAHEKVHTGERQYPCKLCDRSFSYSQSLQRHIFLYMRRTSHPIMHQNLNDVC